MACSAVAEAPRNPGSRDREAPRLPGSAEINGMTSKKKAPEPKAAASKTTKIQQRPRHTEAYEEALGKFAAALERMRAGSYPEALEKFRAVRVANPGETALVARARVYEVICERKLAPPDREPGTPDELYLHGVVRANAGRLDEALGLLDRAVAAVPGSAAYLYARAAVRAQKGIADGAASDLRLAIAADPTCRHQAANDPDFEKIRDEAVFIDVMEPSSD
jgi:tetratricopeptide (TPR) repeat protein